MYICLEFNILKCYEQNSAISASKQKCALAILTLRALWAHIGVWRKLSVWTKDIYMRFL